MARLERNFWRKRNYFTMRAFRVRQRNTFGKIEKHRDYIGLDKFLAHGVETYQRYREQISWSYATRHLDASQRRCSAEICEKINNKWVKLTSEEIDTLLNEDEIVTSQWLLLKGFTPLEGILVRSFSKDISQFEEQYKVISVCINPGNVYVYLREGDKMEPREEDDMVTVFNGDRQGQLKKEFIEKLYTLLTNKKI
jgi:hypothetical protein